MFQFANLPGTLKLSIIELIKFWDLKNLLYVNKELRGLVLYNGPISRRIYMITINHRSLLEKDGRLISDRLSIHLDFGGLVSRGAWMMTLKSEDYDGREDDDLDLEFWDRFILNPTTKWPFMNRITSCQRLNLSLFDSERTNDRPEPIERDLDECFEFYKLLPNLRHSQNTHIELQRGSHIDKIAAVFPVQFQQELGLYCQKPIVTKVAHRGIAKHLRNRSPGTSQNLWLEINTCLNKEEIKLMGDFGGQVQIAFEQEDYFKRSLQAVLVSGFFGEARFDKFEMWMHADNNLAEGTLHRLNEILRKASDFKVVSLREEGVRGFKHYEINNESLITIVNDSFVVDHTSFKQFFYWKRISENRELAVALSLFTYPRRVRLIQLVCRYRGAKLEEKEKDIDI